MLLASAWQAFGIFCLACSWQDLGEFSMCVLFGVARRSCLGLLVIIQQFILSLFFLLAISCCASRFPCVNMSKKEAAAEARVAEHLAISMAGVFAAVGENGLEKATEIDTACRETPTLALKLAPLLKQKSVVELLIRDWTPEMIEEFKLQSQGKTPKSKGKAKAKPMDKKMRTQWKKWKHLDNPIAIDLVKATLAKVLPSHFGDALNIQWGADFNFWGALLFVLGADPEDPLPHIFYPCCIFYKFFGDASVIRVQKVGNRSVGTVIGSRSFAMYWVDSEDPTLIHCLLEPIPDGGNGKAEGIKMAWAKSIVLENPFECNVIVTATMADDRTSKVDWVMSAFQAKGVVFVNSRRAWELDENFEHKESTTAKVMFFNLKWRHGRPRFDLSSDF